jgi:hypothetical protein
MQTIILLPESLKGVHETGDKARGDD